MNYAVERYYDEVITHSIDTQIRDACIEVANKVADDIIAEYKVTNIVRKRITAETLKKKIIIAIELERK